MLCNVAKTHFEHSYVRVIIPKGGRGGRLKLTFFHRPSAKSFFHRVVAAAGPSTYHTHFYSVLRTSAEKKMLKGRRSKEVFGVKNYEVKNKFINRFWCQKL